MWPHPPKQYQCMLVSCLFQKKIMIMICLLILVAIVVIIIAVSVPGWVTSRSPKPTSCTHVHETQTLVCTLPFVIRPNRGYSPFVIRPNHGYSPWKTLFVCIQNNAAFMQCDNTCSMSATKYTQCVSDKIQYVSSEIHTVCQWQNTVCHWQDPHSMSVTKYTQYVSDKIQYVSDKIHTVCQSQNQAYRVCWNVVSSSSNFLSQLFTCS